MDQLIALIQDRTGIEPDQARTAAETVVDFLKDRLPGPIAGQIDGLISGQGGDSPIGDIGGMLGR